MTQNDHSDVYIIPPNFVRDGTLFSGRAEARNVVEAAFLALVGIRFLVFLNLGIKGKIYVGIIPDSATCDIGGDRCSGRKSFLFSYPAVFVSCETACIDRAKRSVSFKTKPPYPEKAEKTLQTGT